MKNLTKGSHFKKKQNTVEPAKTASGGTREKFQFRIVDIILWINDFFFRLRKDFVTDMFCFHKFYC